LVVDKIRSPTRVEAAGLSKPVPDTPMTINHVDLDHNNTAEVNPPDVIGRHRRIGESRSALVTPRVVVSDRNHASSAVDMKESEA